MNLSTPPLTRSQVANGESAKKVEVITVKEVVAADTEADAEGEDEDEITQEEDEEVDAQDDDLDDDDEVDKSVSMRPSSLRLCPLLTSMFSVSPPRRSSPSMSAPSGNASSSTGNSSANAHHSWKNA